MAKLVEYDTFFEKATAQALCECLQKLSDMMEDFTFGGDDLACATWYECPKHKIMGITT